MCSVLSSVQAINTAAGPWGLTCLRYEIRDILLPANIRSAMERQVGISSLLSSVGVAFVSVSFVLLLLFPGSGISLVNVFADLSIAVLWIFLSRSCLFFIRLLRYLQCPAAAVQR